MEEQDYILFDNYLDHALSPDEQTAFENRLETDKAFREAFQVYKETIVFLKHKFQDEGALEAFKANVQSISNAHFGKDAANDKKGTSQTFQLFKYAIAACVVLLFGIFTWDQFSTPTYGDFADYETISLTVRGDQDALLQTAEEAFNTKDFAKADEALEQLMLKRRSATELQFYRALANIELNRYDVADALLEDLSAGGSAYKYKATWYLALSKLKQKHFERCEAILKTIPAEAEDYEDAQKLLKQLD